MVSFRQVAQLFLVSMKMTHRSIRHDLLPSKTGTLTR
jgi:hypothetical protein